MYNLASQITLKCLIVWVLQCFGLRGTIFVENNEPIVLGNNRLLFFWVLFTAAIYKVLYICHAWNSVA